LKITLNQLEVNQRSYFYKAMYAIGAVSPSQNIMWITMPKNSQQIVKCVVPLRSELFTNSK